MIVHVDYASTSTLESSRDTAVLSLTTNVRRPVRFQGVIRRHGFNLRIALQALGETIWSTDTRISGTDHLDPMITVHPDRIVFEAMSQDQSAYAALIVDPAIFETEGAVVMGTTHIDFTASFWRALGEMRTGRRTTFHVGPERCEAQASGADGRFERKVDVPESWVRGFLQVQAAMGMPGTRLVVQPIDLLIALQFLRDSKGRVSPRALRYEFDSGQDARLVLEPWEYVVPLVGAVHHFNERKVIRVWGRRRLKLTADLLPFAESVQVYLKGRALPSFYAVQLAGMTFVLGLSGFSEASFTGTDSFDLLSVAADADNRLLGPTLEVLRSEYHKSVPEIARTLGIDQNMATQLLVRLCRQGRCLFDLETGRYRHRELLERPADEQRYFPRDLRRELAAKLVIDNRVRVETCAAQQTIRARRLKTPDGRMDREITHRDWLVVGAVGLIPEVQVVVNDNGRITFGRCSCPFFKANLMKQGPCEHILALYQASAERRVDQPTSVTMP